MSESPIPSFLTNQLPDQHQQVVSMMQQEDGLAQMLMQPTLGEVDGEPQHGQAHVIADMFNIMRMDTKAIGAAVGVDISIKKMTPERSAQLVQELVKGESLELLEAFNAIEEKRERILEEVADEETVQSHQEQKLAALYTQDDD